MRITNRKTERVGCYKANGVFFCSKEYSLKNRTRNIMGNHSIYLVDHLGEKCTWKFNALLGNNFRKRWPICHRKNREVIC